MFAGSFPTLVQVSRIRLRVTHLKNGEISFCVNWSDKEKLSRICLLTKHESHNRRQLFCQYFTQKRNVCVWSSWKHAHEKKIFLESRTLCEQYKNKNWMQLQHQFLCSDFFFSYFFKDKKKQNTISNPTKALNVVMFVSPLEDVFCQKTRKHEHENALVHSGSWELVPE